MPNSKFNLYEPSGILQFYVRCNQFLPFDQKDPDRNSKAKWSENLIAEIYRLRQWRIFKSRFRIPGSEIDLAVYNPDLQIGKIIEVKHRQYLTKLDSSLTSELLPERKLRALSSGAKAISSLFKRQEGIELYWSLDMALVIPFQIPSKHLVTIWQDALPLK